MTREEYVQNILENYHNVTEDMLDEMNLKITQCNCGKDYCNGWLIKYDSKKILQQHDTKN